MAVNYINAINDTSSTPVPYYLNESVDTRLFRATCSTAAATADKVATLDDDTNYSLATGVRVAVTFTYGNSATTPTLQVTHGSDAKKTIATATAVATLTTGNGTTYNTWGPYETVIFTYNGTYWVKSGTGYATYNAYNVANSYKGTVTQVTAGTGLSIGSTAGGNFTTSGTINHTNSVTAATTQKIYPIAIDAQGHVSGYTDSPITLSSDGVQITNKDLILSQDYQIVWRDGSDTYGYITDDEGALVIGNGSDSLYIHNLGTPTEGTDAATKAYVDSVAGGGGRSSFYGTCSTSASTAAKVVTATGFTFDAGNILCVNFTTANTAATPTLNVNSAGAKTIYIGSTTALSSTANVLKWSANTLVYFMYDGTYFRYITSVSAGSVAPSRGAGTWYGTSSTAAGTTAKTSSIDNYVLTKGAVATITFSTANTVATPTLNINSTGAKTIYNANGSTSATNPFYWGANTTITFVYSGSYYYVLSYHTKVNHVDDVEYLDLARALAEDYSAANTYFVGEFCIYDSNVYECNTAITTAESWTSGHWTLLGTVS